MKKSIKALLSMGLSLAFLAGAAPVFSQEISAGNEGFIASVTANGANILGDNATWGQVNAPVPGDSVVGVVEWHYEIPSIIAMLIFGDTYNGDVIAYPEQGVFMSAEAPADYLVTSKFSFPIGTDNVLADLIATTDEVADEKDFSISGALFAYPRNGVSLTVAGPVPTDLAAVNGEIALTHTGGAASGEINVKLYGGVGPTKAVLTKNFADFDDVVAPQIDLSGATDLADTDFNTKGYSALTINGDVNEASVVMGDDQPGLYTGALTVTLAKL